MPGCARHMLAKPIPRGRAKLGVQVVKKAFKQKAPKPEHTVTPRERAAMHKFLAEREAHPAPRVKISDNKISLEHPDEAVGSALLMEALGTANADFLFGLLRQLGNAGSQVDEDSVNFMLSVVKGIEPRDQLEAMLGAQMAAVHMASMTFARQLASAEYLHQQDSAERAFNKLTRTFVSQMEALKRYRTGGEQKVTVQHVSVSEGGQAIVGNVTQSPRGPAADEARSSAPALSHARTPPMTVLQESAATVVPLPPERSKRK
jgi:hypothetical protein